MCFFSSDDSQYMAFPQSGKKPEEPYDHIKDSAFFYDVTEQFKQQMRLDLTCFVKCEVSTISKVYVAKIFIIDYLLYYICHI